MSKADSVKARLHNLARQRGVALDYLMVHYCIERFLYRLSISSYADRFILKGGLLLYAILHHEARATRDVDFLAHRIDNSMEGVQEAIQRICDIPIDDGIFYDTDSLEVERISEDADYQGVRIKLFAYLDRSRVRMQLDIGFGDVMAPGPLMRAYPSLLDMESPQLLSYPSESVIAEKFEAMLSLADVNSRMKDFYDIYTLSQTVKYDGATLQAAIAGTLERRNTLLQDQPVVFEPLFFTLPDKQAQWQVFQHRIGMAKILSFKDVVGVIKALVFPPYESILAGKTFEGQWDFNRWVSKGTQQQNQ